MQLPSFQTDNKDLILLQNKWRSILNPIIGNPITNPGILTNVKLVTGNNVVDHKLGSTMQGWVIADQNAAASIYRAAPLNALTVTLNSSAPCTVTLVVF